MATKKKTTPTPPPKPRIALTRDQLDALTTAMTDFAKKKIADAVQKAGEIMKPERSYSYQHSDAASHAEEMMGGRMLLDCIEGDDLAEMLYDVLRIEEVDGPNELGEWTLAEEARKKAEQEAAKAAKKKKGTKKR